MYFLRDLLFTLLRRLRRTLLSCYPSEARAAPSAPLQVVRDITLVATIATAVASISGTHDR